MEPRNTRGGHPGAQEAPGRATPPPRRALVPRGAPGQPLAPIFWYISAFDLEKNKEKTFETVAHRPESLLYIFSWANGLIYQKMGARGWPGAPRGTRARLGGWRALVPRGHLGGPLWYFLL